MDREAETRFVTAQEIFEQRGWKKRRLGSWPEFHLEGVVATVGPDTVNVVLDEKGVWYQRHRSRRFRMPTKNVLMVEAFAAQISQSVSRDESKGTIPKYVHSVECHNGKCDFDCDGKHGVDLANALRSLEDMKRLV